MPFSDYVVIETIATSSRSVVQRASRRSDGAPVVLKSLASEFASVRDLRQLEFEFRILEKLDCFGVIRALGFERNGSESILVLEDFGGQSLGNDKTPLSIPDFLKSAIQIARALGAIHARNVIHKDIKPRNLLQNRATGEVKLIDFHVATELSHEHQDAGDAEAVRGSLPYVSPEQTGRMNRELDYRTDYYSLGITFFELVTGRLPFEAADAMGWIHCHISKRAPQASQLRADVPEAVADIIAKLMAKDPDRRYQSSHGLVADLNTCLDQWKAKGSIEPFLLGRQDASEIFRIPHKLFGREREIQRLHEVLDEATRGRAQLLLVSGYSGVGKSSLINEVQKPIGQQSGYFVTGKFEELERDVPYGAFLAALKRLIHQLLSEPDERLACLRDLLTKALGTSGGVMLDLIPELERIIGPQPKLAELAPAEAQHRFRHVFRAFIEALAREQHPLVIFLDDLHWLDASTGDLLVDLFANADICHLLVIGAYRENEVHDGHLLASALKAIRTARPESTSDIVLSPLPVAAVNLLLSETFRQPLAAVEPLGQAIFEKTEGNPFFTNELLSSLHHAGAFTFVPNERHFVYDLAQVRQATVSEDVADLMVKRLARLPAETRAVLQVAACVGAEFELDVLSRVLGQAPGRVASRLWEAIVERVIVPLDANYRLVGDDDSGRGEALVRVRYRFQHDRVQQAAYRLMDGGEQARLHLVIGRLLLADETPGAREDKIFDVVNHLNLGLSLISDDAERALLSELNLSAGLRAKRSAAYAIAARYLERSVELMPEHGQRTSTDRGFALLREHAECVFLAGNPERALALSDRLLAVAPNRQAKGSVYFLRARIVEHQGKLLEAIATIREGLALFGVDLPEDHGLIDRGIGEGIGKMQAHLERVRVEELAHLPEMTDTDKVMTMNLLFLVIPPAIQTYPPLFFLVELMMFDLALTHGVTTVSCKNFVDCGIIQGGILGNYEVAYRLGHVAFELLKRYAPTPLASAVHFVFGAFVSHFRAPHAEGLESYDRADRLGMESGDIQHVAYAAVHRIHRTLLIGRNLEECSAENAARIAQMQRLQAKGQLVGALVAVRGVARLLGSDGDGKAAEAADRAAMEALNAAGNAQWIYSFGQALTLVSVVLGDLDAAARFLAYTEPVSMAGNCLFSFPDYHLFQALVATRRWHALSEAERANLLPMLRSNHEKLAAWGKNSPVNFAHKYELLSAELGRIQGEPLEQVLGAYERAANSTGATGADFIHLRALAHEFQGELWLEKGYDRLARAKLREAYQLYADWGARAKLRALEARHAGWFAVEEDEALAPTVTRSGNVRLGASLDFTSVLKATQAISSEVRTERLFSTLMDTIIENAGAERGCLILKNEVGPGFAVEARSNVEKLGVEATGPVPLDGASDVCSDIVRFVARTRETLVLDDAQSGGGFEHDPYIEKNGVRSLLCIPVLRQGELIGVLYAENNAAPRAFTKERLSILSVIASQAAISITNAKLYDSLEHKVEERTREIARKNREIAAMLDGMEQGVFAIDEDLTIQPGYSKHLERILGTRQITGQPSLALLFRNASTSPDELTRMDAALRFSFGVEPVLAAANVDHFVKEFQRLEPDRPIRSFEVDWSLIVDDDGIVDKILVAVRDVTMLKKLQETAAQKTRELDIVGQILDASVDSFRAFCASARAALAENQGDLARGELGDAALARHFRNLHTIKGNARLLRLTQLVEAAHAAEEAHARLREQPAQSGARSGLERGLADLVRLLDEYEEVCDRKLGPLATRDGPGHHSDLHAIETLLARGAAGGDARAILDEARALIFELRAVPLSEIVRETSHMLASLAKELHKSVPIVELDEPGARLSAEWARVVKDALVHSFRNSLAHGIEPDDERRAAGKTREGRIRLRARRCGSGLSIVLSDDGKGLAVDALRTTVQRPHGSDEEVAEATFQSGVSTTSCVSRIAGRGVGMDVVRTSFRSGGGDATIAFTGESRMGHRPFELVLSLPSSALAFVERAPG